MKELIKLFLFSLLMIPSSFSNEITMQKSEERIGQPKFHFPTIEPNREILKTNYLSINNLEDENNQKKIELTKSPLENKDKSKNGLIKGSFKGIHTIVNNDSTNIHYNFSNGTNNLEKLS